MNGSRKAQRWIERYLRRVERALRHTDPEERREIVDGLRTHIYDGLNERVSGPVRLEDVRAMLASMDAPERYQAKDVIESSVKTARSRVFGRLGLHFLLAAVGVSALSLLLGATVTDVLFHGGLILSGVLVVCALGFGIVGWRDPFGKAAVLGAVLAMACAMIFLPASQTRTDPGAPEPVVEMGTQTGE